MAKRGKANTRSAKPAKKQKPLPKPTPTPRQKSLPGMQDRRIAALEDAALKYADIRDMRMGWSRREVEAKKKVQDLMHEQNRTHYERGYIEIDLVPEDERVRVRVHDRDREEPMEEPVENQPPTIEEPTPDELPAAEPEDPDEVYDSRVSDSGGKEPSEF